MDQLKTDIEHGNRGGGSMHNVATKDSPGFMSAADKLSLDRMLSAPVTKTADFTVSSSDYWIICNGAATINVTLPTPASNSGRVLELKNIAAQLVQSASSNVVPAVGGAAGIAIMAATAGLWVTLKCDGTNWIIFRKG